MSDSDIPSKPSRPINRWGMGVMSVLQLVFLAAFLVAANYLATQHYKRVDLSREGAYSISPATERYLTDAALAKRERPVKWIMAWRKSSPFFERTRALAEEYARKSGGKIELELIDPLRGPARAQQVMASYGLSLVHDMILIDARADDAPVVRETAEGRRELNTHVKIATAEEMVIYTTDNESQRRPTSFQGEDVLTARLVEAIEGKPRRMLFLADKSRVQGSGDESPWAALEGTLRLQNIELAGVNLSGMKEVPADAEGVALVAPKYDLTDEELAVLEAYWNRPRAALLILLEPGEAPPKLRAFLRSQGVTPRRDRVVTRIDERTESTVRAAFTYGVPFLKDLAGQTTLFEGASCSLEVRENQDDLMDRRIFPIGLIEAAEGYWGESKFGDGKEAYDEREDQAAPLFLAAGVVRGAEADDRFAAGSSRMVVMSNIDFLKTTHQQAANFDFLASASNWLVGRESLAGIGPRSIGTYKMPILDAQVSFINRVNLFFLPGFLILVGAFIWSSRRA